MLKSETISELAKALAKAQGEIKGAKKDANNPFFKSMYADLASCHDAIRESFAKHGLSVIQPTDETEHGLVIETVLMHTSGEFISSRIRVISAKQDPQAIGSAITYYRRYSLCSLVGLSQVDDDGNLAVGHKSNEVTPTPQHKDVPNLAPKAKPPIGHVHKFKPYKFDDTKEQCGVKLPDGKFCNFIQRRSDLTDERAFGDGTPIFEPPKFDQDDALPF